MCIQHCGNGESKCLCVTVMLHYISPPFYMSNLLSPLFPFYIDNPYFSHYSLHYCFVTLPSYDTFTLNTSFVVYGRPTFHIYSTFATYSPYYLHFCMDILYFDLYSLHYHHIVYTFYITFTILLNSILHRQTYSPHYHHAT